MSNELVISIEDFRKITGITPEEMTDSVVLDSIDRLETLANIYIDQAKNMPKES